MNIVRKYKLRELGVSIDLDSSLFLDTVDKNLFNLKLISYGNYIYFGLNHVFSYNFLTKNIQISNDTLKIFRKFELYYHHDEMLLAIFYLLSDHYFRNVV